MKHTTGKLKFGACALALMMLTACGSTKSESVVELTKNDKRMSCTELELEMTEAEFFRDRAERNKGMSVRNVMMPLGYPSTYLSADRAIEAANGRVEYLTRLHEVKGCGENQQQMAAVGGGGGYYPAPAMAGAYPSSAPMMYQPMRYEGPAGAMSSPVVRPMGY